MPDKWGRIGYNDFMGITRGLQNIQAMGHKSIEFAQEQEDREKNLQYEEDYEGNLRALGTGPSEAPPHEVNGEYVSPESLKQPVQMVGSERSRIAAKNDFAIGLKADLNISDAKQETNIKALSEKITAWKSSNPDASFDQIPIEFTAGVDGQKAKANVIGIYGESAEAQKMFMKNRIPIIQEHAKSFFNNKKLVNDALGAGNTDMAVNGLIQMSKELTASPYQLGDYNPETKAFDLKYFDRRTGKLQKNGTKPLDEVVTEMNALGEKEFISMTASSMEAKRQENLKEEANPKHGKTTGGTAILVTAQINPMKQDGTVEIAVRNEKTGETIANYPSWDAFYDAGNSKEDLSREESKAKTGASNALAGQRNAARNYDVKRTNALGGKKIDETVYDDQGNPYPVKSEADRTRAKENGWTYQNPKMNETMYENNVKSFATQTKSFGFTQDEETKDVSGIVKRKDLANVLKTANDLGISLFDESQGVVIDSNGWVPGGKEEAVQISVLPMGTKKSGGDPAVLNDAVAKFDTDTDVDPAAVAEVDNKTNAMGGKAKTIITQMSKDEIKDIYRFGAFDEPGTTPWTAVQKLASNSQSDKHEKFGEGKIEKAIRDAGIETDLQKQKSIAKTLKSKFPKATEAQIVAMIKQSASKAPGADIPGQKKIAAGKHGLRHDGKTQKGNGYFGELPLPGGKGYATEVSIGIDLDGKGKDTEIPALVPTLTQKEIDAVLRAMAGDGEIPQSVYQKAIKHAKERISEGKSPFASDDEQVNKTAIAALGRKK